jgi:hypothetical protein
MNPRKLGFLAWPALLASMAASACSGNNGPAAEAFVYAQVGPENAGGASACGYSSDQLLMQIGSPTAPLPSVKSDGTAQNGYRVHVTCKVDGNGNGFDIQLSATLEGSGSMTVSGHISSAGTSMGLNGSFTTMGNSFRDNNCSFSYMYNNAPLPGSGAATGGRIWGHVDCPNAVLAGQTGTSDDGGSVARTCDGFADFLFQNCG